METPTWLRPSSLPFLQQCPEYTGSAQTPAAMDGTAQHAALAACLANSPEKDMLMADLTPGGHEAVTWAAQHVQSIAQGAKIETERRVSLTLPNGMVISGTVDNMHVDAGVLYLSDFKRGEYADCRPQLAAYAVGLMQELGYKTATAQILYGRTRHIDEFEVGLDDALARLSGMVQEISDGRADDPARGIPSDACTYCGHAATCPALAGVAMAVVRGIDVGLETFDPISMRKPETIAKALAAATVLDKWSKAVRERAKSLAQSGTPIPGYAISEAKGKPTITDISAACHRLGLDPDEFLGCCNVAIGKLAVAVAEKNGQTLAVARAFIDEKIADLIQRGAPSVSLRKSK